MGYRLAYSAFILTTFAGLAQAGDAVNFTMKAHMPSLNDPTAIDQFTVGVSDKQIETSLDVKCEAPKGGLLGGRDRSCAVSGLGSIINPGNGQKLQRTQYMGGWRVKSNGYTDATTMSANYLAVGKVAASSSAFSGSMVLKPETPSSGAVQLRDSVMANLKAQQSSTLIDTRVDTVQFNNFTLPSTGFPSDKGCVWNGDMIYAYQTQSWFMNLKMKCNDKEVALKGNMPFTETKNVGNQHQYDLTLMVPNTAAQDDAALFTKGSDTDLFAAADGLSGQVIMKESAYVDVTFEGHTDKVPIDIDASGSITANNTPVEVARSFAMVMGILARTFFGS
jgi:hypothetical protein